MTHDNKIPPSQEMIDDRLQNWRGFIRISQYSTVFVIVFMLVMLYIVL